MKEGKVDNSNMLIDGFEQRSFEDFEPTKKPRHYFSFESRHAQLDITLFCWGLGFDAGYTREWRLGLWLGPVYIEIRT